MVRAIRPVKEHNANTVIITLAFEARGTELSPSICYKILQSEHPSIISFAGLKWTADVLRIETFNESYPLNEALLGETLKCGKADLKFILFGVSMHLVANVCAFDHDPLPPPPAPPPTQN